MSRQTVLQGLRQSILRQSTPSSATVIDKKTAPIYRSVRQPLFFMDGTIAAGGREPLLVCSGPRVEVLQPDGSASWVPVSPAAYDAAVIGQPFNKG